MNLPRFLAIVACGLVVMTTVTRAQLPPDPNYVRHPVYDSYSDFKAAVNSIVANPDPTAQLQQLNAFWTTMRNAGQVPFAIGDRVAFMYRGNASSVAFRGDFNGWGTANATKQGNTDLWMLERTLPSNARSDYKPYLNGTTYILDPANPLQMWSGFGPNSELRMPDYVYPRETVRRTGVPQGNLSGNIRFRSNALGYDMQYRVYTPANHAALGSLPVVYVTDGHEYAAEHMGSMTVVLDNLIADGVIRPAIAVFIDPRDPNNLGNNRRAEQYVANNRFVEFVKEELIPRIDTAYDTIESPAGRTMMGTSLGGLNAAYFGAVADDAFGNVGIQSPAFQVYTQIYSMYQVTPPHDVRVFMTGGTLGDNTSSRNMLPILVSRGYEHQYVEVNEGHSWGAWRAQLDDLLLFTVGAPIPEPSLGWVLLAAVAAGRRR
jgi:enterochelin esterase family protein